MPGTQWTTDISPWHKEDFIETGDPFAAHTRPQCNVGNGPVFSSGVERDRSFAMSCLGGLRPHGEPTGGFSSPELLAFQCEKRKTYHV